MRSFHAAHLACALLALGFMAGAQGRLIVADVHGDPGFDYRSLKDAVLAAADGDAVLVRTGVYTGNTFPQVTIQNKSVTVFADPQSPRSGALFTPVVFIRDIPAGKSVTLRGLRFANLQIENCAGRVLLDDCHQVNPGSYTNFAVTIENSEAVTLTDCSFYGSDWASVVVDASQVHAFRSRFEATFPLCHGVVVADTQLSNTAPFFSASACSFRGGPGRPGSVVLSQCYRPARGGGDGVLVRVGTAQLDDCQAVGGQAAGANGPCPGASAGLPVRVLGGAVHQTALGARSMTANTAVREGQTLEIEVKGQTGDFVWLLFNDRQDPATIPGIRGSLIPSSTNLGIVPIGVLGSAPKKLELTVQPLGLTQDFGSLVIQSLVFGGQGWVLTPPKSLVLLDQRF